MSAEAFGSVDPQPVPALRRHLVVGNPIAHSRSPEIHSVFAGETGIALRYERLLVQTEPPEAFTQALDSFFGGGGYGANVTLPFKEQAFRYAARRSERAALAEAVNTLAVRDGGIYGDNTDGSGLIADLTGRLGLDLAGKSVLLLGAGGAAKGVVMSLLQAGVAELHVFNRTPARAEALAARFNQSAAAREAGLPLIRVLALSAVHRADLIINATSGGLLNRPLVLPAELFRDCGLAYDCVYGERPTDFMEQAIAGGAGGVSDGLGMLVEQAAESFLIWHGVRPATASAYRQLRAAMAVERAPRPTDHRDAAGAEAAPRAAGADAS